MRSDNIFAMLAPFACFYATFIDVFPCRWEPSGASRSARIRVTFGTCPSSLLVNVCFGVVLHVKPGGVLR